MNALVKRKEAGFQSIRPLRDVTSNPNPRESISITVSIHTSLTGRNHKVDTDGILDDAVSIHTSLTGRNKNTMKFIKAM